MAKAKTEPTKKPRKSKKATGDAEKKTVKSKGGRPKVVWQRDDWDKAERMAQRMATAQDIAHVMGVSGETLTRLIKDEYGVGFLEWFARHRAHGCWSLRQMQWKHAERSHQMAVHLGVNYLGQTRDGAGAEKETEDLEDVERDIFG